MPPINLRRWVGFVVGIAPLAVLIYYLLPDSLPHPGKVTAAIAVLMGAWMTEALPIPATALVPLVAFPLLSLLVVDRKPCAVLPQALLIVHDVKNEKGNLIPSSRKI